MPFDKQKLKVKIMDLDDAIDYRTEVRQTRDTLQSAMESLATTGRPFDHAWIQLGGTKPGDVKALEIPGLNEHSTTRTLQFYGTLCDLIGEQLGKADADVETCKKAIRDYLDQQG